MPTERKKFCTLYIEYEQQCVQTAIFIVFLLSSSMCPTSCISIQHSGDTLA